MAKVTAEVCGGDPKVLTDVSTVGDVRSALSLDDTQSATINGEPADDDSQVRNGDFVGFAKKTKGGC